MVRVKICGITHPDDAALCVEEGADALGFVVEYPLPVPWNLTCTRAAELMRAVPPLTPRVAVVGGDAKALLRVAEETEPDLLQLHLDETEEVVAEVARGLRGTLTRIVKAIRIDPKQGSEDGGIDHWVELACRFREAGADAILLDSKIGDRPAGTGEPFDWKIARRVAAGVGCPVVLAGGLTPENVGLAVRQVRPYAVDVISSVEDGRHRKVRDRVRAFLRAARAAGV